ncbi:phospholipase A2-activating protein [Capsaspora owczarzaki ATCC 30864]|uniref:phospholipase A2-activating protein n=1 Tax=Capsaspora owczarzaki (strain ATCC 30864) TaxID=595528 RepID=UPI0001FE5E73|nr:phospholipase A2-activating protein [Capsaspora owczarzaki ATCC 30864]|eukprot:XP_004363948.1 phospholipase A2-activating protein [Capsaspora owczarzaki ATCC 30864]
MTYTLSKTLLGHEQDVRSIATCKESGVIVTGSRDRSARVWRPPYADADCTVVAGHHSNFIVAVYITKPTPAFPQGTIVTASNDRTANVFLPDALDQPLVTLAGHTDTVSAIGETAAGLLVTGSWDKNVRVWDGGECLSVLSGHEQAVWAVLGLPDGDILTGSADKTIRVWRDGSAVKTIRGHRDCVRGLALLTGGAGFVSCSNDSTVRIWTMSGEPLQELFGHTSFVYSVAALPNGAFVSSGEDRCVKLWNDGACVQTINLPVPTIWAVAALPNNDIVVGSSDGAARIFTADQSRVASDDALRDFDDQVAAQSIPSQQIGDIDKNKLPGLEGLSVPGTKDGQNKIVRNNNTVEAYQWSAAKGEWTKVGDVVDAVGSSRKQLLNGKEYDYVFNIVIEEGKPAKKLGYNTAENPWMAAQRFVHENELDQFFLDQVAKFIMDNTKGVSLGTDDAGYADPFTGGNRYVPGNRAAPTQNYGNNPDPYTGGNSFVSGPGQYSTPVGANNTDPFTGAGSSSSSAPASTGYFPQLMFINVAAFNYAAISKKLRELNDALPSGFYKLSAADLAEIDELARTLENTAKYHSSEISPSVFVLLNKIMAWPEASLFPVLDLIRLVVLHPSGVRHFAETAGHGKEILLSLIDAADFSNLEGPEANRMLSLRFFANAFSLEPGRVMMNANRSTVLQAITGCLASKNKNTLLALATVLLNYAVLFGTTRDKVAESTVFSHLSKLILADLDDETQFRACVAIGTLLSLWDAGSRKNAAIAAFATKLQSSPTPKVASCAAQLRRLVA